MWTLLCWLLGTYREWDIYTGPKSRVIVYVGHYLYLTTEWKRFRRGSVIFMEIAAILNFSDLVNALSQELLVRINRDFM